MAGVREILVPLVRQSTQGAYRMYEYDDVFYNYINTGALKSAHHMLPLLIEALPTPINSVLDVGCGVGAWLAVWKSLNVEVLGLDGSYVDTERLLVDQREFIPKDLNKSFSLDRRFSLAQSLEVAEHLPPSSASDFIASLCRHADMVLFSAATPGQGGENHINEQNYTYWRDHFRSQGYAMYDPVRHRVAGNLAIKPWYRYNTFLYVNESCSPELLEKLLPFRVEPCQTPLDIAPLYYKLRRQIVRILPPPLSTLLARVKKNLFRLIAKFKLDE
jgi:SAM-dependent methyltransferase